MLAINHASSTAKFNPIASRLTCTQPFRPVGGQSRRRPTSTVVHAAAAAAGAPDDGKSQNSSHSVIDVFNVFSDPRCNRKMLALAIGQMLCSVATLMHDAYLPVYVQDVLGLSNTQVTVKFCYDDAPSDTIRSISG